MRLFLFVFSWFVDFLLLMGVCQIYPFPFRFLRIIFAAMVSAGYCVFEPLFPNSSSPILGCICMILVGLIAFGWRIDGLRNCGVFLLLRLAIAGILQPTWIFRPWPLLLASILVLLLCALGLPERCGNLIPIELSYGTNSLTLTALRDTGNTLHDPITGKPVLILGADAAQDLVGLSESQLRNPTDTMGAIPGLRLIPYRAIGGGGLLLALRLPHVRIGPRSGSALVAFAPEILSKDGKFQALTGGVL